MGLDTRGITHLSGYAIVETSMLKYDEVVPDRWRRVLLCGERRHLVYVLEMQQVRAQLRTELLAHLDSLVRDAELRLGLASP